ncbi:MAG: Hint domain-containing protein, partial [Pseudomonadota bacterium]
MVEYTFQGLAITSTEAFDIRFGNNQAFDFTGRDVGTFTIDDDDNQLNDNNSSGSTTSLWGVGSGNNSVAEGNAQDGTVTIGGVTVAADDMRATGSRNMIGSDGNIITVSTLIVITPSGSQWFLIFDDTPAEPFTFTTPNGGTNANGAALYTDIATICFADGTQIETDKCAVAVEDLEEGMLVRTRDNGFQPIRWVGSSTRVGKGKLAPIRIAAGTLGNTRDLRVSPQHRMLLEGWQAELLYGEAEVLAPAKSLVNDQTIRIEECDEVEYFHILFDTHEVIFAEGAPSESFHPAEMG